MNPTINNKATTAVISIAISALTIFLFATALNQPFIGDDYWWLFNAEYVMSNPGGWIDAFFQMNGSGFYRPITQNVFFFLMYHAFGFHALWYHITAIFFYLATGFILYKTLLLLYRDYYSATVGASVYLFSSINYSSISWVSAFSQTGSSLFFVSTLYLYILGGRYKKYSYISFVLCLLSSEITSTLPAFLLLYELLIKNSAVLRSFINTILFWLLLFFYIILRFMVIGIHPAGPFGMVQNLHTLIKIFGDSLLWISGFTPTFVNATHEKGWDVISIFSYLTFLTAYAVAFFKLFTERNVHVHYKFISVGLLWIVVGMTPVLIFSLNDYNKYTLAISLVGFSLITAGIIGGIKHKSKKIISSVIVLSSFFVNLCAIYNPDGNNNVQGLNVFGAISHKFSNELYSCGIINHKIKRIYVVNGDRIKWIIGYQWEAKVVLQSPSVKTILVKYSNNYGKRSPVFFYKNNKIKVISCGVIVNSGE